MANTQAIPGNRRRSVAGLMFRAGTYLALLLVVGPALWILLGVVVRAVPHWQWNVLTTPTKGTTGGLENAILGTLILMLGVLILAGTTGVLAGLHLAELAKPRRRSGKQSGGLLRMASDVLSGFPSIVLGYCGYVALVVGLHWGFSLLPALIILSIMVIPYIAKSTESALRQVPDNYREGAAALGMSMGYSLRKIVLKTALPGIVTGLLIALAIAVGETAPLIYTASFTDALPGASLIHSQGFPYLTYPVFTFFNQPGNQAHYLAYDAALLLVVIVLVLLVVSRIIVARTQRYSESRGR
jgi:phosphate transport system permease protein